MMSPRQYRRTHIPVVRQRLMAGKSRRFAYHQHMHVAATDETSPVAGRQQCIGGKGLVGGPKPVALHIKPLTALN